MWRDCRLLSALESSCRENSERARLEGRGTVARQHRSQCPDVLHLLSVDRLGSQALQGKCPALFPRRPVSFDFLKQHLKPRQNGEPDSQKAQQRWNHPPEDGTTVLLPENLWKPPLVLEKSLPSLPLQWSRLPRGCLLFPQPQASNQRNRRSQLRLAVGRSRVAFARHRSGPAEWHPDPGDAASNRRPAAIRQNLFPKQPETMRLPPAFHRLGKPVLQPAPETLHPDCRRDAPTCPQTMLQEKRLRRRGWLLLPYLKRPRPWSSPVRTRPNQRRGCPAHSAVPHSAVFHFPMSRSATRPESRGEPMPEACAGSAKPAGVQHRKRSTMRPHRPASADSRSPSMSQKRNSAPFQSAKRPPQNRGRRWPRLSAFPEKKRPEHSLRREPSFPAESSKRGPRAATLSGKMFPSGCRSSCLWAQRCLRNRPWPQHFR